MKDPIQIYENLKQQYLKYIETTYSVENVELKDRRKELYLSDEHNLLAQEPYLELIRAYPSAGRSISKLKSEELITKDGSRYFNNEEELQLFKDLCLSGLIKDFPLYEHQLEMLKNYTQGHNCIITTGTGSGKTESFLIPLFAYLAKNLNKWKASEEQYEDFNWYRIPERYTPTVMRNGRQTGGNPVYEPRLQRPISNRKSAVKAIIIYPMNALVDDQMSRLRKSLDSENAERFYAEYCNKHRIYFGQYNGATPTSGFLDTIDKKNELAKIMRSKLSSWQKIIENTNDPKLDKDEKEDLLYSFQKVGGSELLTRFDIQSTPPDILITNYSMLNVMLMRDREDNIFDATCQWLEEDKKENIFHIIVDELHLNRGTAGTELALLLKLVEFKLGLYPGHPQLRILASSASLDPGDEESKKYISDFFGMDFEEHFKIVKEQVSEEPNNPERIAKEKLEIFYDQFKSGESSEEESISKIFGEAYLVKHKKLISEMIMRAFNITNGRNTLSLGEVKQNLFGTDSDYKALKGLLLLRAQYNDDKYEEIRNDLPRIRFHLFFKNIEALYTQAGLSQAIQLENFNTKVDGRKVMQNLYCDECGTVFYGGRRLERNGRTEILPISTLYEVMPDLNLEQRPEFLYYEDFVIFWPSKMLEKEINPESEDRFSTAYSALGQWCKSNLDTAKGELRDGWMQNGNDGYIFRLVEGNIEGVRAFPSMCPQCAQTYIFKQFRKSPVRTFKTGYSAVAQVLSSNLLKQLNPNPDKRKILIFSDSRSAAAEISNQLERNNYNDAMRKNFFRLGLIEQEGIIDDINNFFETKGEDLWNWDNLDNPIKEFCEANISNETILTIRNLNGIAFRDVLLLKMQDLTNEVDINSTIPIRNLLPNTNSNEPNLLFKEFLLKGINPVGNDFRFQSYENGNGRLHWSNIYNLDTGSRGENMNGAFHQILSDEFSKKVCAILFGRSHFSIETMAKGYVTFPEEKFNDLVSRLDNRGVQITNDSKSALKEMTDTFIRILGNKYRHLGADFEPRNQYQNYNNYHELRGDYIAYFDAVFENNPSVNSDNKQIIVTTILEVLNSFNPDKSFRQGGDGFRPFLHPREFDLTFLKPEDIIYKCSNCGANHAHFSAGVCAHCFKLLDEEYHTTAESIWTQNYYTSKDEAIRIHCEELTGQTDSEDIKARQRAFKNIFIQLDEGVNLHKKAEQIDALSVTTTMEVGVDIGSLEATLLANMPPERYNYQQRVGRAGRGGQAYSIALTLCRGNSHDSHYYYNLDGMINASPPTPFIPIEENSEIARRMVYKLLLREVFKNLGIDNESGETRISDNHGEFGLREDFIENNNIQEQFIEECDNLLGDSNLKTYINTHLYFTDELNGEMIRDDIINKITALDVPPEGLAESLAEAGLLPMYGMPTRTRALYHDYKKGRYSEIARDLDISISEYAPGNEITKDKKIFEVTALTAPILKAPNGLIQYEEPMNGNVFSYSRDQDGTIRIDDTMNDDNRLAVRPKSYFSNRTKDSENSQKPFFSISISRIVAGQDTIQFSDVQNMSNAVQFLHHGQVCSFNENYNGDGFLFGDTSSFSNNGLLRNDLISDADFERMRRNGEDVSSIRSYDLASNKATSLLQIRPKNGDQRFQFTSDLFDDPLQVFRAQGVKAAIYSAAFILRTAFTQHQDIDDSELDILGLRIFMGNNDRPVTAFAYADKLPNGSGFTQKLSENLSEYIALCLDPLGRIGQDRLSFIINLLSENNQVNCDAANYTNLLNYRNKRFHPLLNWRLGTSFLRILRGSEDDLQAILTANPSLPEFGNFYGCTTWLEGVAKLLKEFVTDYNLPGEVITECTLPHIQYKNLDKLIIPVHPLWSIGNESDNPLVQEICEDLPDFEVKYIDAFNLANRPGDCYEKLELADNGDDEGNINLLY